MATRRGLATRGGIGGGTRRTHDIVRLLLLSTALCWLPGNAQSQTASRAMQPSAPPRPAAQYSIPAQPLAPALAAFGEAARLQVLYSADVARGASSPGLEGAFSHAEALRRLLAGTGLSYRFTNANTVTIERSAAVLNASAQMPAGAPVALDAVVVEGEKTSRDYFQTYTSIGVVTGQQVVDYDIASLARSFELLGNVRSFPANRGNNGFVIRGLNSEGVTQPTRSAPIISVVIDGAPQNGEATRRGSRGVWDVEQIEVMRGPQSTLQGRNSLGGTVLVTTKNPTWTPEMALDGQVGNNDYRSGAFMISSPFIPNQVAARLSGQMSRETKDITYTDPAAAVLGKDEFEQVRAKLLVTPEAIPGLTALFTLSHTYDKPGVSAVTGPNFFARRFDASLGSVEFRKTTVNNHIADISYEMFPGWKLQSVTSFTDTDTKIDTPAGSDFQRKETRTGTDFSQDLRLTFNPAASPLTGVIGLFAGKFSNGRDSLITFGPLTIQDLKGEDTTTSIAAYADLRYRFLERWTLIGGGRVLKDRIESNSNGMGYDFGLPGNVPIAENTETSNTAVLPKLGLAFDITASQVLAATLNRGYRAGFAEVVAGSSTVNRVAPEFLWAYELAYRSKWFEDRLQLNANVFYYDYSDQQIVVDNPLIPSGGITQNAGKSHAYGAELEARARVFDGLTVFGSVGLLKTRFDEAVTNTGVYSGNSFPEAPTVTASFGGLWKHETGFFAGADVSYTDGYYSAGDLSNDPGRFVDSFVLVNARIGFEHKHGTVTLFARNLLDRQYLTSISDGYTEATIGDGRMIGVRGTARF